MARRQSAILSWICGITILSSIKAAGFTTHNTAARRTSQFEYFGPASSTYNPIPFQGLAMSRSDAIQGGAPYPDYLYTCGDDHDAGEEAHWTPFQIAAANYIRENYPDWTNQPRDQHGPGLVAFMLGVTSHYIADMNWHGLETVPSGEGIIRTMGFADFNCTNGDLCQIAHTAADTGGEFAAAMSLDLSWYPHGKWFIPTTDLVNIYDMLGISVQESWITECAVIFYAGSFAVSRLGDIIYEFVIAPRVGGLLLEEYVDFPVGGVDDMAGWTGFMWNRFAEWVSGGPPDVPPNAHHDSVHPQRSSRVLKNEQEQAKKARIHRRLSQRQFASAIRQALEAQGVLPLAGPTPQTVAEAPSGPAGRVRTADVVGDLSRSLANSFFEVTYKTEGVPANATAAPGTAAYVGIRDKKKYIYESGDVAAAEEMKAFDRVTLRLLADALLEEYALQMWTIDSHFEEEEAQQQQQEQQQPAESANSRKLKIAIGDEEIQAIKNELYFRFDQYLDKEYPTTTVSAVSATAATAAAATAAAAVTAATSVSAAAEGPSKPQADGVTVSDVAQGTTPHEYFGASITVANFAGRGDGSACDILVGSYGTGRVGGPQEGSAQILFNAACSTAADEQPDIFSFRGGGMHADVLPSYERFGWASAAADINGDGNVDAVICSPSFGGRNVTEVVGNYTGRCDVFYGPFQPAAVAAAAATATATATASAKVSRTASAPRPDVSIYGDAMWGMFGYTLTVGDVDGDGKDDLIVAAPGAGSYESIAPNERGDISSQGAVFVFLGSTLAQLTRAQQSQQFVSLLASEAADHTLQRPVSFQYFGRSLQVVTAPTRLLLVGAPFFHLGAAEDSTSAVGRIFAYSFTQSSASAASTAAAAAATAATAAFTTATATATATAMTTSHAAAAAPKRSLRSRNALEATALNSAVAAALAPKDYEWSITGCLHAGRTGQTMAYSSALSVLAIGEPAYNGTSRNPKTFGRSILRSGRVVLVPMQSILDHTTSSRDLSMCEVERWSETNVVTNDEKESRFGNGLRFLSESAALKPATGYSPTGKRGAGVIAAESTVAVAADAATVAATTTIATAAAAAAATTTPAAAAVDPLIVSASLAGRNAGAVTAVEVSKTGNKITARNKWTLAGADALAGESKARLGFRALPLPAAGTDSSSYKVLISAPFADCGGVAPDGDQLGKLILVSVA